MLNRQNPAWQKRKGQHVQGEAGREQPAEGREFDARIHEVREEGMGRLRAPVRLARFVTASQLTFLTQIKARPWLRRTHTYNVV